MRVIVAVLFSAVAAFAQNPQVVATDSQVPDNLSIPARLSKTIDTNKCKPGDVVEMQTLEPVLITNGLVMPENTKLRGRVLGAASRQDNRPSWVVLVVEQAQWKQHDLSLHAFVAGQITAKAQAARQNSSAFDNGINSLRSHRSARTTGAPGREMSAMATSPPQDAVNERNDAPQVISQGLDDVRLMKAENGAVFLVSQKPHLKLSSGTMFMLRNQLTLAHEPAAATKAPGSAQ
jgi:hypothetical protein